jgi:hypothetical protein
MNCRRLTCGRDHAVLAAIAAGCLALSACGAASNGDTPGEPQQPPISAAMRKFCTEIAAAMKPLNSTGIMPGMSLRQAHMMIDSLMAQGIAGFTTLAREAPSSERATIEHIVTDFRAYEQASDRETSVQQMVSSIAGTGPAQQPAYQQLLSYTSDNCY